MTGNHFKWDERLEIELPSLIQGWDSYESNTQAAILAYWEAVRGHIPDRIMALERTINEKQARLYEEEDFGTSCRLNSEIAELASKIHDLHIWYRTHQDMEPRRHSG
ncbi:hypothetical protein ACFOQM_00660 [Paenibacillus sp. GCM10012307]|uniref:Uncharacterized protein n=1 Tax=Paenibacillus roseus TaxID=2798579 RepID=A0A934IY50_9BACL|nr:hypothetical protein [Paenibacillus roseus]MBJ6359834.1 hypothetical protein [Paenibacillus roseus]